MGRKRKAETRTGRDPEPKQDNISSGIFKTAEGLMPNEKLHLDFNAASTKKNATPISNLVLRRSGRVQNSVSLTRSQHVHTAVELINSLGNGKQQAAAPFLQVDNSPVLNRRTIPMGDDVSRIQQAFSSLPVLDQRGTGEQVQGDQIAGRLSIISEKRLEEKFEYLVQSLGELLSKISKAEIDGPSAGFSYRSLYIDSQKKMEALMEENFRLTMKLEFARGKIEAYEKMRDAALVPSLGKSSEAGVNLTSPAKKKKNKLKKKDLLLVAKGLNAPKKRKYVKKKAHES